MRKETFWFGNSHRCKELSTQWKQNDMKVWFVEEQCWEVGRGLDYCLRKTGEWCRSQGQTNWQYYRRLNKHSQAVCTGTKEHTNTPLTISPSPEVTSAWRMTHSGHSIHVNEPSSPMCPANSDIKAVGAEVLLRYWFITSTQLITWLLHGKSI